MAGAAKDGSGGGGKGGSVMGLLLATLLAAGGGIYLGSSQFGSAAKTVHDAAGKDEHAAEAKYTEAARLRVLNTLTTNLAGTQAPWIRLEASVLVANEVTDKDAETLTATITEDLIAYLRTLSVTEIQGPSGFQNLREDLDERVRIRSEGSVKELIIQSMIIE